MKKLLTLTLLIGFLFVGCQDDNSILEPQVDNNLEGSLNKFSFDDLKDKLDDGDIDIDNALDHLGEALSEYNIVLGYTGGDVPFSYDGPNGFHAEGKLTIPKGAYFGLKQFRIEFDPENYTAHFFPSPTVFDIPLILDMKFTGMDLSDVNRDEIEFNYIGLDGELEKADYDKLVVRKKKGILKIVGAKLPHFSRYGWTRTKPTR